MQAHSRKFVLVIACLLIPVLFAEVGIADPSVFKTHIKKTVGVANLVQQTGSEGSQRRAQLNRLSEPQAIAVDNAAGRLYWTDTGVHKIYRANFDGLGQQPLVEWAPNPRGIAVVHDKIYWSDSGTHQINRANMDGSSREILLTGLCDPQGIAVDRAAGKLYWTDTGTHQIYRANLNGSDRQILVKWSHKPLGIAIDSVRRKLYWIDSGNHQIHCTNLDGSGHHVIVKWVPNPQGIAVDDVGGKIYWTDSGTHKIHRANLNGSGCETLLNGRIIQEESRWTGLMVRFTGLILVPTKFPGPTWTAQSWKF
jgi:DNA-binding beta-propeller fold protein YncE